MSINENQEFEQLNQQTRDRRAAAEAACYDTQAIYLDKKAKARKKASGRLVLCLVASLAAIVGIYGLEAISWISKEFSVVLMCAAGAVAMFKVGYFYHEMKR